MPAGLCSTCTLMNKTCPYVEMVAEMEEVKNCVGFIPFQHVYPVKERELHTMSGMKCPCNPKFDDGVIVHNEIATSAN